MDDVVNGLLYLWRIATLAFGIASFAFAIGAAFTLGCVVVCRAMSWAPVNITIINRTHSAEGDE